MNEIDLKSFRWIVVNSSGGKDSQTALREVVRLADAQGIARDRIVVSHQCLGRMEWEGTRDLAQAQAAHYGLRFEVSKYRNAAHVELTLLDYVRAREKWPSSQNRFCTSEFKRSPGARVITKLSQEAAGDVLQVFGFRAEESPARAKKNVFVRNARISSQRRTVMDWLPIHNWTQAQVWADIKASGVPYHQAYDLGMPRLSCAFCIFAPKAALMIAGKANPELLDEYVKVEAEIGHSFKNGTTIKSVQDSIKAGELVGAVNDGNWNM
jgi:3'-phosphoadenosine 5'-phosphosulfate sulfotransferase (PAPS reductase)/FAD synthetase